MITKCAICESVNEVEEILYVNRLLTPASEGGKLYFKLWHFPIQKCHTCNYVSKDISTCENKGIVYKDVNNEILEKLQDARENKIEDYLLASEYYSLINDDKNYILCLLQASDLVYNEIMYWREDILEEGESCEDLMSYAESLYTQAIQSLKEYILANPNDIDMHLLLVGFLQDDDKETESRVILENIKKKNLTNEQKLIVQFLEN